MDERNSQPPSSIKEGDKERLDTIKAEILTKQNEVRNLREQFLDKIGARFCVVVSPAKNLLDSWQNNPLKDEDIFCVLSVCPDERDERGEYNNAGRICLNAELTGLIYEVHDGDVEEGSSENLLDLDNLLPPGTEIKYSEYGNGNLLSIHPSEEVANNYGQRRAKEIRQEASELKELINIRVAKSKENATNLAQRINHLIPKEDINRESFLETIIDAVTGHYVEDENHLTIFIVETDKVLNGLKEYHEVDDKFILAISSLLKEYKFLSDNNFDTLIEQKDEDFENVVLLPELKEQLGMSRYY
ncbi:MAG: hypothetical protein WCT11_02500 [Candidatus Magasanikbacteria bacterium]